MTFDSDNMYCGAIARGEIFLCAIDCDCGQKTEKAVVILQDNVLNESMPTVVCAVIEPHSVGDEVFANEIFLKKSETGLGKDAICMLHKIVTVDRPFIISQKGRLRDQKLMEIYKSLDVNLGRFRD
ncbi:MAG: type II toxin-antitoxin system PemK/MazF family toxin [bacterium]